METIYIPDLEYVPFVHAHEGELLAFDGKNRWVCLVDGKKTIVRPESSKPQENE